MLNLNHLRSFIVVAEELNFGRAAARLNMTQPPLSRQIQMLESMLGATLLERNSRSVQLTATGRNFLPEARRLVRAADSAVQLAGRLQSGKSGSLKITFTAASAYQYLPDLLSAWLPELTDIDLSLREMGSKDQIEAILAGESDIGLIRPPIASPELKSVCVLKEPLVAAVHHGHPLAQAEHVVLEDLDGEPFIMYSLYEAQYFHNILTSLFTGQRVMPKITHHLSHDHSILAMVKAGLGCALVPESARNLRYEGVVFKPLKLRQPNPVKLCMVWRKHQDNPVVNRVLSLTPQESSLEPMPDGHCSIQGSHWT